MATRRPASDQSEKAPAASRPRGVFVADRKAAARVRRALPSFRDFVEYALFHPRRGYYSAGVVRIGDGGDYDTFPSSLSPVFGAAVVRIAFDLWRQWGKPPRFGITEVGAGNGCLASDIVTEVETRAARDPSWQAFAAALEYRICEKSPALRARQAAALGPLGARVQWSSADLSRPRRPAPAGAAGIVIANEVLDCLAHHKVVRDPSGQFWVAFVGARRPGTRHARGIGRFYPARDWKRAASGFPRATRYTELFVPAAHLPQLQAFLKRHYPPPRPPKRPLPEWWVYYACPEIENFIRNAAHLYDRAEILLIDYGGLDGYHRRTPAEQRLRAGRPREHASPYRAPGHQDITFLVDFSVAIRAASAAGLTVEYYGPQAELLRRGRVRLGDRAVERILHLRVLRWLLAVLGAAPDAAQRRGALTWKPPGSAAPAQRALREEIRRAAAEFLGRRPSRFRLLVLAKSEEVSRRGSHAKNADARVGNRGV